MFEKAIRFQNHLIFREQILRNLKKYCDNIVQIAIHGWSVFASTFYNLKNLSESLIVQKSNIYGGYLFLQCHIFYGR